MHSHRVTGAAATRLPPGCGRPVPLTETDAVLAINDAFYRAFVRGDFTAMDAIWSQRPSVACIHPGWSPLIGRSTVMESWRAILANPPPLRMSRPQIFALGDTAFVVCRELVGDSVLAATNVFVREEDGWKLVHHQAGPTPETAEAAPPHAQLH